jgi:uncharacterized protein YjdB
MAIVPATQTALAVNQTANFIAIGTTSSGATVNLTNQSATINGKTIAPAVWSSSNPSVATVIAGTGVATALSGGATAIVAIATNPDGTVVTGTAVYTVTVPNTTEPLVSLVIVPASQTSLTTGTGANVNFIAIGTTSTGATVNMNAPYTIPGTSPKVTIPAAAWASSNPVVATVSNGVATPLSAGATAITAVVTNPDGTVVSASAAYTVTAPTTKEPLVSLAIVPATQTSLTTGASAAVNFIAIGTTGAGTTVNLTNQTATVNGATLPAAVWSSSNPAVATINAATGVATPKSAGATAVTAIVTNPDGTVVTASAVYTVTVPNTTEPLVSLAIVPASQTSLTTGASAAVNFIAIGTTGTGSTVNLTNQSPTINGAVIPAAVWSSSNPAVAIINAATGSATPVSAGATAITAIATNPDGTVVTASAVYTVSVASTKEPYVSLAIVPASQTVTTAGQTAQFLAIATTGSGTTVDLTSVAKWSTSSPAVATITGAGQAAAVANGAAAITAEVANPGVGGAPGDGTVVTASAVLTVSIGAASEPLLSLSILPAAQSVAAAGETTQFLAIGNFSSSSPTPGEQNMANISTYTVIWYSSNPQVASVNPATGVAVAVGPGTTAITAIATNIADKSGASATASFSVTGPATEPIAALSIFPGTQSITLPLPGSPLQTAAYIAIGTNGTTGLQTNVTTQVAWSSTNPQVATINSGGIATALSQGATTITAIATNADKSVVTATATLTVAGSAPEPLLSLAVIPVAGSVAYPAQTGQAAQTVQFTAIGTFSAPPATQNVTAGIASYPITTAWTSSNPQVATVCTAGSPAPCTAATDGLVTAVAQGSAVIIATATNPDKSVVTGSATFTVLNPPAEPVATLQIVPLIQSVAKGQTGQFLALGTNGATGLQSDMTTAVVWSSSIPTVASINPGTGLATGLTSGVTTITAQYTNADHSVVTGTATLTVTETVAISSDIISVAIQPSSQDDFYIDQTTQFIAIGTSAAAPYTFDVTNCNGSAGPPCFGGSMVWASSNIDVATINTTGTTGPTNGGLGGPAGLATMEWEGVSAITATFTNADGSIATGVSSLTCPFGQCDLLPPPVLPLVTLTVFGAGNNTTNWLVTAPSATGAADAIHCGPGSVAAGLGAPVCVGSYPVGSTVTLTTFASVGGFVPTGTFGGFASGPATITVVTGTVANPIYTQEPSPSYCTPAAGQPTQTGVNTCTMEGQPLLGNPGITGDDTVVAIFNN